MNRRSLLRNTSLGAIALSVGALAGCSGVTASQASGDANLIANGLSGILADLKNIPGIGDAVAKVAPQIQAALDNLSAQAAQIGNVLTNQSGNIAQSIAQAVGVVATFVTPFFPAAPLVAVAVQAAITLAQGLVAALSSPATAAAVAPVKTGMSVEAARLILAGKSGF